MVFELQLLASGLSKTANGAVEAANAVDKRWRGVTSLATKNSVCCGMRPLLSSWRQSQGLEVLWQMLYA